MNYIQAFKDYLLALKPAPSKITVKNYSIDVKHFITWIEERFQQPFSPASITSEHIQQFQNEKKEQLSLRSLERHLSSLRKFFQALKLQGFITENPFEAAKKEISQENIDPFFLRRFKDFLYVYNASNLTIKNYIIDVKQFLNWAQEVTRNEGITQENLLARIDDSFVSSYRDRLFTEKVFSPASINRKLSSLRKYLNWAASQNLIDAKQAFQTNLNSIQNIISTEPIKSPKQIVPEPKIVPQDETKHLKRGYSSFPPIRLTQKLTKAGLILFDILITSPMAYAVHSSQKALWLFQGKPLFVKTSSLPPQLQVTRVKNLSKSLFSPLTISLHDLPWYEKLIFHTKHTRPNWYKRYHSYAISNYFHWAILMIFMTTIGFGFYNNFVEKPKNSTPALAATAPPRILSFQGRLTDINNNPITTSTNLRFAIYTDPTASGSAQQWQEVDTVTPDTNGVFSVLLGNGTTIPQSLFANNSALYLGIAVGSTAELTPRQQLATVAYATNAETLQGLPPITNTGNTTNVVLALDGSGNLTIGGSATPVFTATGGQFTLAGKTLTLSTVTGSNTNVQLAPDGKGLVDVQKPLTNTTRNNNIASAISAVEVDDIFAVLATSSGQSAITVNQNGSGPIFTASSSGTSRFTINNSGALNDSNYTTLGGILYTDASGNVLQTSTSNNTQCLVGGSAPTWTACSNIGQNFWQISNGALVPVNSTVDMLVGATSTAAAKFAVLNVNPGGSTTVASVSAQNAAGQAIAINSAGSIQTVNMLPLTIGGNTTGSIQLSPKGSTGIFVNGAGNVGIQTTNQANALDVNGNAAFGIYAGTAAPANDVIVSGSVGIGTTNPSQALDVVGNIILDRSSSSTNFLYLDSSGNKYLSAHNGNLNLVTSNSNITLDAGAGSSSTIGFNTAPSGSSLTRMFIDQNGNVGVGTTSPGTLFDVEANSTTYAAQVKNSNASGFGLYIFTQNASSTLDALNVQGWNGSAPINGLDVKSIGFVGIGTTNNLGNAQLVVNQTDTSGNGDILTASAAGTTKFTVQNDGTLIAPKYNTQAGILYMSNTTGTIAESTQGSTGQCFVSGGSLAPSWTNCSSAASNWWNMNNGAVYPINSTLDLLIGASATTSAKFAVLNVAAGTPTASVSSGLNGTATYFDANGNIQTANEMGLTIGGTTTGNITLSPLNSGAGSTINNNAANIATNQTSLNLYNTTATTVNFAGAANTLNVGATGGTTTFRSATIDDNQSTVSLFGTPTTVNFAAGAAVALNIGGGSTPTNLKGNVVLGTNNTNTITPNGLMNADLIPTGNGVINLGSSTHYYNTIYADNFVAPISGGTSGFWSLANNVIFPVNNFFDLAVGGTSTASANWQVFSSNLGSIVAGTASSSGNLSFRGAATKINLLNGAMLDVQTSLGGDAGLTSVLNIANNGNLTATGTLALNSGNLTTTSTTGNLFNVGAVTVNIGAAASIGVNIGNASGTNTIRGNQILGSSASNTINAVGEFNSSLVPNANNTYDLGTLALGWRNLYISGNYAGFWQRFNGVVSPFNITDDLAIGGTATSSALFQVFGNTGNATTSGTLTFTNTGSQIQTVNNSLLSLGGNTTGGILLQPNNGLGLAGVGTTLIRDDAAGAGGSNGQAVFSVSNTSSTSIFPKIIINGPGSGNAGEGLEFYSGGTTQGDLSYLNGNKEFDLINRQASGFLSFQTFAANGAAERMRINNMGFIGIGTSNVGNAQLVVNQQNLSGLGDIFTASAAGTPLFTIANDGSIKNNIIPNLNDTYNLGSDPNLGGREWNNLYVRQIITPGGVVNAQYWQLNSNVLSPSNVNYDLAVGGTSTASAKFQVFATGSGAGSISATLNNPKVNNNSGSLLASTNILNIGSANHTYMTLNNQDLTVGGHKNLITLSNVQKVFVYDTAKDSDGGRWTNDDRAQTDSWYTEARTAVDACIIGTNTRCGTQAFPRKAILVATSTNLYIFDAKDNSLWMQFTGGSHNMLTNATGTTTGLTALNGEIYISYTGSGTSFGLSTINFINDKSYAYGNNTKYSSDNKGIVNRNVSGTGDAMQVENGTNAGIAATNANDVSVNVINGKTYFAVATAGGSNGSVTLIDESDLSFVANFSGNVSSSKAWLTSTGTLYALVGDGSTAANYALKTKYNVQNIALSRTNNNQTFDVVYATQSTSNYGVTQTDNNTFSNLVLYPGPAATTAAQMNATSLYVTQGTSTNDGVSNTIYIGEGGLDGAVAALQENQASPAAGTIKYFKKNFITDDMVGDIRGYWPLNETSGNLSDASIRGNTLIASSSGVTYSASGVRGTAVTLDGSSGYLYCPEGSCGGINSLDISGNAKQISAGAWIKTSTSASRQVILSKFNSGIGGSYLLTVEPGGKVLWGLNSLSPNLYSVRTVADGNWHYVVATYDGANMDIYIDGQLDAQQGRTGTFSTSSEDFAVGAYFVGNFAAGWFNGSIDQPFISATPMEGSEVQHQYEVGYRALQTHGAQTIRGTTIPADGSQKLANGNGNVTAVATSISKNQLYVGTNNGISLIGLDSDSINDVYNNNITTTDDTGSTWALNNNYITSLSVGQSFGNGSLLVFGSNNGGSGGMWIESQDTLLKDVLATSYNPFGTNLTQSNLNVDTVLRVSNQLSTRLDNLAINATSSAAFADAFRVDNQGILLSRSLINSTTAMQFQDANANTVLNIDTTNDRVGIGTTTPAAPLQIGFDSSTTPGLLIGANGFGGNNTTNYLSFSGGRSMLGYNVSGNTVLNSGNGKGFDLYVNGQSATFTSGTDAMHVSSLGFTGIGSGTSSNILGNAQLVVNQTDTSGLGDIITASASGATEFIVSNTGVITASSFQDLQNTAYFLDPASVGTSLTTAGSVGIGTTSVPNELTIGVPNGTNTDISFTNPTVDATHISWDLSKRSDNNQFWIFGYNGTTFWNPVKLDYTNKYVNLVSDGTGFVGIGTTAPNDGLTVNTLSASGGQVRLADGGSSASLIMRNDSSNTYFLWAPSSAPFGTWDSNRPIILPNDSDNVYLSNNGGSVGIGTTNPGKQLDLSGRLQLAGSGLNGDPSVIGTTGSNWLRVTGADGLSMWGNGGGTSNNSPGLFESNGNLTGVNTTGPTMQLTVVGGNGGACVTSGCYTALFSNQNTGNQTNGIAVELGIANGSRGSGNYFVSFAGGTSLSSISVAGKIQGCSNCVSYTTSGSDYAEYFYIADPTASPSAGDLVEAYPAIRQSAVLATDSARIVGVVSNRPGFLGNDTVCPMANMHQCDDIYKSMNTVVGMVGQIPTNISNINGEIQSGDYITASNVPGFGEKQTTAGNSIGMAIQPASELFSYSNENCPVDERSLKDPNGNPIKCAQIMTYVHVGWYDPQVQLATTGDLQFATATPSSDLTIPTYYTLNDIFGNPISRMGAFLELAVANLRAGTIQAQQTITGTLAITTDGVSIAGQSLRNYILNVVQSAGYTNSTLSPIASVDQLHTNLISPLASDSAIAVDLTGSKFTIRNSASGSAVASIDNTGNATFSGTLNSQNLAVNSDATISGTLHAHKIVADQIEGLAAAVGTLSAQNITNVTNIFFATPSGTPISNNIAMGQSLTSSSSSELLNPSLGYENIGSYSSFLAYVPNLSGSTAIFDNGLSSLGSTVLSDTTITGQLSIGATLTLANNSINVLGQSLEIQPLKQGGVNFEGGLLAIDTDGNLTVNGNAVFGKTLAAHIISPLSNNDNLTFQLGQNPTATGAALATANLSVQNASGSGIFSVDQLGNLVASGAANIAKLNFNLVAPALAVSDTEVIATGSAGTAVITAHQTEVTIDNPQITSKSLIYITPVGQSVVTPYLIRQVSNTSFTVGVSLPQNIDTNFNWLIVN